MANTFSSQNSSENLYTALIVIFGMVLGYLLYSNQFFPIELPVAEVTAVRPDDVENAAKLESLRLNFGIFDNISFRELKIFGAIPVVPGATGKNDPFNP